MKPNIKKTLTLLCLAMLAVPSGAQKKPKIQFPEYQFTPIKEIPVTPVKNQYRSGTCWCFSALGFVESEIIRMNGITDTLKYPDFSEMFVVSKSYQERAEKFVRLDGKLQFSAGSEGDDVLHVIRDYGLVPQDAMPGTNYGTKLPVHAELDALLKAYVDVIAKNPNKKISTAWKNGLRGVLDAYLGPCPESFEKDGNTYTPASYRDSFKFNPDDYVSLTSFTHHPFYGKFVLELADNWRWDQSYNVPLEDLMNALDAAINNGYTVEWAADVSHPGFTRDGLAIYVDPEYKPATSGSDQEHWVGKAEEKNDSIPAPKELTATQESRQEAFDNKTLTDDHGMVVYGIARDQFGSKYYIVKNSWGPTGKYKGIWYASEEFMKGQTISLMMHKDALPNDIRKKLNIK